MKFRTCAFTICLLAIGCSKPAFEIAPVEGVLMIKGRPGDKISIQFVPDIDQGTKGPVSTATTDSEGRFTLSVQSASAAERKEGAVVGWHRVVLSDLRMSESATGQGVPIRLTPDHSLPGSTPLRQEVKPGPQTIKIELP